VASTAAAVTPGGAGPTYVSTTLGLDPSVFYRLADGSSAAMTDSSPNQATGSYVASNVTVGGPAALPSDPASSVSDQGRQQGIGSAAVGTLLPLYSSPRSAEVWVNTTWNGYRGLVSWGQSNTDQGFTLGMGPTWIGVDGYGDYHTINTPYPIDDGAWHMLATTFDGRTITVYLDGVELGTTHFNAAQDTLPGNFVIGSYPNGPWQLYSTALADAAVFPTALTPAQIAAQFAASGYGRPTAVGGLSATAGANQATVSWSTPATAPGNTVEGYVVTAVASSGAVAGPAVSVPAPATSATVTGLAAGVAYTFQVEAVDSYGQGAVASTAAAVTPSGAGSTYVSTTLGLDPSAFYRLADGGNGALADSSPNQATGYYDKNVNALGFGVTGPLAADTATAVQDSGYNIGTAYPTLPSNNSSRTIEVWLRTTNGGTQCMAGWGNQSTSNGFDFCLGGASVYVQGYSDDLTFTNPTSLADGNWHFVAVTATATSATVYVDGALLGTQNFPTTLDTTLFTPLQIGSFINGGYGFYGDLADLAVFPTTLTATQVGQQYTLGTTAGP
jgi:large repetitive protein